MPDAVILSDTHLPRRSGGPRGAGDLPPPLWAAIDAADVVVHAGDWVSAEFLERVASRARLLVGCAGNNDDAGVCAALPTVARATIGGVRLAVVHETGAAAGRERRVAAEFGADTDLVVFGHSHIPWDSSAPLAGGRSLRLLNPGSPTDRRRQPAGTWLTARLAGGEIAGVVRHEVRPG